MNWDVRRATSDDDLAALVAIVNTVAPDDPTSVADLRWDDRTYGGTVRLLVERDGRPLAAATVGRIHMFPPDFDGLWGSVDVLPEARRHGIGEALLAVISEQARTAGKSALHILVTDLRPEGEPFLAKRGFVEYERWKALRLDLAGLDRPESEPPSGVVLTSLAERPELVEGVHAVAVETFPDIPTADEPIAVGTIAEFRARDVDRPGVPPEAFVVAVEAATGRVVGYGNLLFKPGSTTVAFHDMTAVVRDWRGRGLAGALKRTTIAWAIDHGLEALETGNDEDNAPMRAVNARLGYLPQPDFVMMRGMFDPAMMSGR